MNRYNRYIGEIAYDICHQKKWSYDKIVNAKVSKVKTHPGGLTLLSL